MGRHVNLGRTFAIKHHAVRPNYPQIVDNAFCLAVCWGWFDDVTMFDMDLRLDRMKHTNI